ncbi:hypothetical protein Ocin01_00058 [Orchesella cincta]|uniref:Uncharacterized protein n=1 Tax=Orchesella cincta TaxID=48709 RepID=A0A1D2NMX3_ORCCI|nr:hypothetical protein Ocin01_00058 [Orchesella cincta]
MIRAICIFSKGSLKSFMSLLSEVCLNGVQGSLKIQTDSVDSFIMQHNNKVPDRLVKHCFKQIIRSS